ncbi:hypothetical protein FTV88_0307 [Heliorestis convoluta]|uniref:Uncharacterized protein n=1 Tax=Heliorestis convoluta TaxID=356322 RepID=A0A5Q2MZ79_9FIRM|nr:hypothetical protein FTV88_0307 [Heliorestis convoluta]
MLHHLHKADREQDQGFQEAVYPIIDNLHLRLVITKNPYGLMRKLFFL